MKTLRKNLLHAIVVQGFFGLALSSVAMASPPSNGSRLVTMISGDASTTRQSGQTHPASRLDFGRLDLSAPKELPGSTSASIPVPSERASSERGPLTRENEQDQLPGLGTDGPQAKSMGRLQQFAHNAGHEGLPVARLWENHSALVSLGLSPRGKPGLWLIQKIK
jgi:hypothetical protein